jgi:hypothetical protein
LDDAVGEEPDGRIAQIEHHMGAEYRERCTSYLHQMDHEQHVAHVDVTCKQNWRQRQRRGWWILAGAFNPETMLAFIFILGKEVPFGSSKQYSKGQDGNAS